MEASKGAVYGLGLSQFAITLGFVLFFPSVDIDLYVPHATLRGNHSSIAIGSTTLRASMAIPVMGASLLAAMFALVTYKAHEQSLSEQDFQSDSVEQMGLWDMLFWVYCLASHCIVILIVCDPVNAFGAISSTVFMTYFLFRACYPKPQSINLTQENLNILGYCLGVLQVFHQMTPTRENNMTALMLLVIIDYFLGIGHTYDRQATIATVSNCRLFYICAGTMGTALLYAMSNSGPLIGEEIA
jgi:hypothetical protein